jgi:hypothetical protein
MKKPTVSHRDLGPIISIAQPVKVGPPGKGGRTSGQRRGAYHSFANIASDRKALSEKATV